MTDLSLDHVLIAVHDLEAAGRAYSEGLGFTVTPAGRHPDRGTSNRLIVFDSEYLELIAADRVDRAATHRPDLVSFLGQREGLLMFALGTPNIERTVESLRLRGLSLQDPAVGSRMSDSENSGYSWRASNIDPALTPGSATFLIQHDQTIEERYRQPANPTRHQNGALGLRGLTLAVRDTPAAASRWRQLFGLPAGPISTGSHPLGKVTRATLRLTNCELEFVSPQGPGPVHDILTSLGEYPVMMSLGVGDIRRTLRDLESRQGAQFEIVSQSDGHSCLLGPAGTHGLYLLLVDAAAD